MTLRTRATVTLEDNPITSDVTGHYITCNGAAHVIGFEHGRHGVEHGRHGVEHGRHGVEHGRWGVEHGRHGS